MVQWCDKIDLLNLDELFIMNLKLTLNCFSKILLYKMRDKMISCTVETSNRLFIWSSLHATSSHEIVKFNFWNILIWQMNSFLFIPSENLVNFNSPALKLFITCYNNCHIWSYSCTWEVIYPNISKNQCVIVISARLFHQDLYFIILGSDSNSLMQIFCWGIVIICN